MTGCNRCDPPRPTTHDPYGRRSVGLCVRCAEEEERERREWMASRQCIAPGCILSADRGDVYCEGHATIRNDVFETDA